MARMEPAFADAAPLEGVRASATCAAVLLAVVFALAQRTAHGADDPQCVTPVARVASAQGAVEMRRAGSARWETVQLDGALCAGDMVRAGRNSRAAIALSNDISLRLDQRTTLTIAAPDEKRGSLLELCKGALHFITRYPKTFMVITPFVNAAVDGTEFYIGHGEAEDSLTVFEGRVVVTSEAARLTPQSCDAPAAPAAPAAPGGNLTLAGGESAVVAAGQAPQKRLIARPQDAVQWALYYPPIIDSPPAEGSGAAEWQTRWNDSQRLLQAGDAAQALSRIGDIIREADDPRFFIYRAGLLLQVGRVDEANRDIARALQLGGRASDAHALQAIVHVVRNEKDQALAVATQAVEEDQKSAAARIALSYARQAQFKLDDALHSARDAAKLEPQNAIAWARVAELEMSIGNLGAALAAAKTAAEANPRVARTQVILGFANLTRIDTAAAKTAFDEAIRLDSADPLPRLGLGLAKIKQGALREGRAEIEIAVSLDPGNSIMRSYMGKAYYEEKRDELAGTQFDLAKERDPHDPTPWFYDAIRKQGDNRPVEALRDLQTSIDLNDNRAVYRSRLLLDQDLAARSASQARLFSDLGFRQLALVESYRSLALDPGNDSAHRFLAESYFALPRHNIARVSELLQSQLNQHLNPRPLELDLGETSLFALPSAGPTSLGLNEFTRLYLGDQTRATITGLTGSRRTRGDQIALYGIRENVSFSLGQLYFGTDGFERNNQVTKHVHSAFVQAALTPQASVQAEIRQSDLDRRLVLFPFDPVNTADQNRRDRNRTFRLGLRYAGSPDSQLLLSGIHQRRDASELTTFLSDGVVFFNPVHSESTAVEAQHLWRGTHFAWIAGGNVFRGRDLTRAEFDGEEVSSRRIERHDANLHSYLYVNADGHHAQFGLSLQKSDNGGTERSVTKVDPKFGVVLNPLSGLTLRAAWLMATKRPLLADQTLEPAQVAGFNQFFDDGNGIRSERAGIGADLKFSERAFTGVELTRREVQNPPSEVREIAERLDRAYFYIAPSPVLALRVEVFREFLQRPEDNPADGFIKLDTYRAPVGITWFGPMGLSAALTHTYVSQRAELQSFGGEPMVRQNNEFWTTDASLTLRLPGRRGVIDLGVRNLFDKRSSYQEIDATNPVLAQARFIFGRLAIAL